MAVSIDPVEVKNISWSGVGDESSVLPGSGVGPSAEETAVYLHFGRTEIKTGVELSLLAGWCPGL